MTNFILAMPVLLSLDSPFKKVDHNTSLKKGSVCSTYLLKAPSGQDEGAVCPVVPRQTSKTL